MKKIIFLSHSNRNIFTIPLIVASLLILGVLVYVGLNGTEIRSRAANPVACTMATKNSKGTLTCPSGSILQGNLCCLPPAPTPKPVCKTGIDSLCVNTSCEKGYRYATVTCLDGFSQKEGGATSCKTSAQWASYGEDVCKNRPKCTTPTPTPVGYCTPNGSECRINCPPIPYCPNGKTCPPVYLPFPCSAQNMSPKGICVNNRCVPYTTPAPTCTMPPACASKNPPCTYAVQGVTYCPIRSTPTPTPRSGCYYKEVQCIKAPCDPVLVCPVPTNVTTSTSPATPFPTTGTAR